MTHDDDDGDDTVTIGLCLAAKCTKRAIWRVMSHDDYRLGVIVGHSSRPGHDISLIINPFISIIVCLY